jgi:hypothetical protein
MLTLGIDFAAQPKNTAICEIHWTQDAAFVTKMRCNVSDEALCELIGSSDKAGIDVPLGWPLGFVRSVRRYSAHRKWLGLTTKKLQFRSTDFFIHSKTGRWPLSVSSDRIGIATFRVANLIHQLGEEVNLDGSGKLVEVYPAAALRIWGYDATGYKKKDGAQKRCELAQKLVGRTAQWLHIRNEQNQLCNASDNALDALVAALVARASACRLTEPLPSALKRRAGIEGWIALPMENSLDLLCEKKA